MLLLPLQLPVCGAASNAFAVRMNCIKRSSTRKSSLPFNKKACTLPSFASSRSRFGRVFVASTSTV
jgi:hypothetical protein